MSGELEIDGESKDESDVCGGPARDRLRKQREKRYGGP